MQGAQDSTRGSCHGKVPASDLLIAAATAAAARISGTAERPAVHVSPCQPPLPSSTADGGAREDAQGREPLPPWQSRQASPELLRVQLGATQQPRQQEQQQAQQAVTAPGAAAVPVPPVPLPPQERSPQQPGQDEQAAASGVLPGSEQQPDLLGQEAPACRAVLGSMFVGRGQLERGLAAVERLLAGLLGECSGPHHSAGFKIAWGCHCRQRDTQWCHSSA